MSLTGSRSPIKTYIRPSIENLPDEWTMYRSPTSKETYYWNKDKHIVTMIDIKEPGPREHVLRESTRLLVGFQDRDIEVCVHKDSYVVSHETEMVVVYDSVIGNVDQVKKTADYWTHISDFPCHRPLTPLAEAEALQVLGLALAQNIASTDDVDSPFSKQEALDCINFFQFQNHDKFEFGASQNPIPKTIMISYILQNFYYHRSVEISQQPTHSNLAQSHVYQLASMKPLGRCLLLIACCGIPPDHRSRFDNEYETYQRTIQPANWALFLNGIKKEREDMNIISGLLLSSSVALLAMSNLNIVSQFSIIMSIGLSLSCVVMGFNPNFKEELSKVEKMSIQPSTEASYTSLARAMDQHTIILLFSVFTFALSLFALVVWNMTVEKFHPIPLIFYVLAFCGLMIVIGFNRSWNLFFLREQR